MIALHLKFILFTALLITGIALASSLQRYRPAYFFFGGWVCFLGIVVTRSIAHMGGLSSSWLAMEGFQLSSLAGTTLFMVTITDRARLILKERNQTRQELLRQSQNQSIILARSVEERTEKLKLAMEAAEDANQKKTWFIAHVSHDLRAPISAIIGLTNIFKHHGKKLDLPERFDRFLDQLHSGGEFLMLLLNNILDFSAFEMNAAEVNLERIELDEWVESSDNLLKALASERNIHVDLQVEPRGMAVESDRTRLTQILLNLAHNAIKFSPKNSSIQIKVACGTDLVLEVCDEGPGIPASQKKQISNQFSKGDHTAANFSGRGLGLSIVERNARLLHGEIDISDVEPSGSTFTVRLPLVSHSLSNSTDSPHEDFCPPDEELKDTSHGL